MRPGISVVVPVFNAERYLDRCIGALSAQNYPDELYEVLLVDNNSTDRSVEIANRYAGVEVLAEPRQGAYAARNRGIRASRGEIIAFTDPDCVAVETWLESIAEALGDGEGQIVLGKREFEAPSRGLKKLGDYDSVLAEYIYSCENPEIYFGYCNNMAVRAPLLTEGEGFHQVPRGADTVLVRNTAASLGCEAVRYVPQVRVLHLEIDSVASFYRKRLYYGTSNARLRGLGSARPLSQRERWQVYRRTVRSRGYSSFEALELLTLLSFGVVFYSLGRLRGRLG